MDWNQAVVVHQTVSADVLRAVRLIEEPELTMRLVWRTPAELRWRPSAAWEAEVQAAREAESVQPRATRARRTGGRQAEWSWHAEPWTHEPQLGGSSWWQSGQWESSGWTAAPDNYPDARWRW